jgi:hypothetical protein
MAIIHSVQARRALAMDGSTAPDADTGTDAIIQCSGLIGQHRLNMDILILAKGKKERINI